MVINPKPIVWSVAGSDSGGGAGLQADLQTITGLGAHACTVVTAVTSQNSLGVSAIETVSIEPQLTALAADMPAQAIKIGMLVSSEQIIQLSQQLRRYRQDWDQPPFVVYDPVMIASSGDKLSQSDESLQTLSDTIRTHLLPCVDLLTPNKAEAELLTGLTLRELSSRDEVAKALLNTGCQAVIITGGHLDTGVGSEPASATDVYTDPQRSLAVSSPRLNSPHHHGSGCVFASAMATLVALDYPIEDALVLAKAYINRGIKAAQAVGAGTGPITHTGWPKQLDDFPSITANTAPQAFPRCDSEQLGLYPVVDSVAWIEKLLKCGIRTLQLRIKDVAPATLEQQLIRAIHLGRKYRAQVFINDYWQLAIKHQAYGVHLGQEDLHTADLDAIRNAGLRLGVSSHGYYEMLRAHSHRPSYIAIGAIYATTTKDMPSKPQGLDKLHRYVALMGSDYPLVAIGGISLARAPAVWQQKPGSIALVSAITKADNYQQTVQKLMTITGESYVEH
jgi:hydroxymethylpyrimidine kinase / phosphomethylpyrimidine kinase / thiamine-phosphate diphosphorylase